MPPATGWLQESDKKARASGPANKVASAWHSYPHPCSVTTPCTTANWGPYSSHPWHARGHPTSAVRTITPPVLHAPFTPPSAHLFYLRPRPFHPVPEPIRPTLQRKNWSCFVLLVPTLAAYHTALCFRKHFPNVTLTGDSASPLP